MDEQCTWTYREWYDYWQTDCGEAFVITDGTPGDSHMRYCPYCGRQLVETPPDRDPDEAGPGMRAVPVCPVHDYTLPCPSCDMAAGDVEVTYRYDGKLTHAGEGDDE